VQQETWAHDWPEPLHDSSVRTTSRPHTPSSATIAAAHDGAEGKARVAGLTRIPRFGYCESRFVKCGSLASLANASAMPIFPARRSATWLEPMQASAVPNEYVAR